MLDWGKFSTLSGDERINFERLCRSIIRLSFGGIGQFFALKSQPGVEFHLKLNQSHEALGQRDRWWGWQCKWFETTAKGDLKKASKDKIEDSLAKTHVALPGLTDWVLWTPYTLTKKDQSWFEDLNSHYTLHLWADEEVNTYLGGHAAYLRSTFFGELILAPHELAIRHKEAIEPIKSRWIEEAHQSVDAERQVREMLGETGAWLEVNSINNSLKETAELLDRHIQGTLSEEAKQFKHACLTLSETLSEFHENLDKGLFEDTISLVDSYGGIINKEVALLPKKLRNQNSPDSFQVTNTLDDMHDAQELLGNAKEILTTRMVAILADAGGGKTQMAAQLTAPMAGRPAGVLFRGKSLKQGGNLDDLSKNFHIDGAPVNSIENLLRALDSAAIRSGCRLPLVIDGLNESEEPRDWYDLLSSLDVTLKRYPNVLVVCTLRTGERRRDNHHIHGNVDKRKSFAQIALPQNIRVIESDGFGEDTQEAIRKYFDFYKIKIRDNEIADKTFEHPLNLRIFCETTNPQRKNEVVVDHAPASITLLFEKYLENIIVRISEMKFAVPYTKEQVEFALYHLGICLWESGTRDVSENLYKQAIDKVSALEWDCNLINLLSEEGVIFRNPGNQFGEYLLTPTYDLLGGYLVADSLLKKYPYNELFESLNGSDFLDKFNGENHHHLAVDVFRSLVTLMPHRTNGTHWWQYIDKSLQGAALFYATDCDASYIDSKTVQAIKTRLLNNPKVREQYFPQLEKFRGAIAHPLNAAFLDSFLNEMSTSERDLSWTEWLRKSNRDVYAHQPTFSDLEALESQWKKNIQQRSDVDQLKLLWIKWFLTSTDHAFRDNTTRAIYWYGRGGAKSLFDESLKSLAINDLYVPERMLAASYGVAMALHTEREHSTFTSELNSYARSLYDAIFSEASPLKTTHILICEYASRTIELALQYDETLFSEEEVSVTKYPYEHGDRDSWGESPLDATDYGYYGTPFRMDFANYTIGRLLPNRQNYDFDDPEYKKTRSQILWRVEELGWSEESFGELDKDISNSQSSYRGMEEKQKTDRYGKKYSWIAYHEMAGMLYPYDRLDFYGDQRPSLIDIDPSFPEPMTAKSLFDVNLLGSPRQDNRKWMESGDPALDFTSLLTYADNDVEWVVLDGHISQRETTIHRDTFCFIRSFLAPNDELPALLDHLQQQEMHNTGWRLPDAPSIGLIFSGEVGWCTTHPEINPIEMQFVIGQEEYEAEVPKIEHFLNGEPVDFHRAMFRSSTDGSLPEGGDDPTASAENIDQIERRVSMVASTLTRDIHKIFRVYSPVCRLSCTLDTASHDAESYITLSRGMNNHLQLANKPQSYDLFQQDGTQVTFNASERHDFNNNQSMFLMRKNLLEKYLEEKDLTLLRVVWGERNLLNSGNTGTQNYKVFSHITGP